MTSNRLHTQSSPYLLQHVDNPVHWQPWDDEALQLAKDSGKPILLSIGYSACHWCHVMAHESFEDAGTAAVMNEHFVNIKIDREERPDLDQIYQLAHQMLTQRGGGWPLTMFLTPEEQVPFFGGTYFPPRPSHGLPAFQDLLARVNEYFKTHQETIAEQGEAVLQVFRDSVPALGDDEISLTDSPLESGRKALLSLFDSRWGGFGGAPKFPQTPNLEFLMRTWRRTAMSADPDLQALYAVTHTLTQMARGGLYDQTGGGFYRYTVDHNWRIPHFEKMLYDNAQLLPLYAQAWRATGEGLFGRIAHETADWMLREMRDDDHGFYAALDADSEGHEGKYYVWDKNQVQQLLTNEQYEVTSLRFGLDEPANFEGAWHFYLANDLNTISKKTGHDLEQAQTLLAESRAILYTTREQRERPFCDTKRLASSNSLALRSLAIAARHLDREDLIAAANETFDYIHTKLWHSNRLWTTRSETTPTLPAYLNDYAYLLDAVLELLQTHWRTDALNFAIEIADQLVERFYDPEHGGFFFTATDHEKLLHRMKPLSDDASPAGNGIAVRSLNRLGHLLAQTRYLEAAERSLQLAWEALLSVPHGHCSLLEALDEYLLPVQCVVIRGPADKIGEWLTIAASTYAPGRLSFAIPDDAGLLPGALASRISHEDGVAYLCEGHHCQTPITSKTGLLQALKKLG